MRRSFQLLFGLGLVAGLVGMVASLQNGARAQSNIIPGGGGNQTPWTANENAAGYNLFGLSALYLTNLTAEIQEFPTGTNAIINVIVTNASGVRVTNTITVGGGQGTNIFRVPGLEVDMNGDLFIGTNNQAYVDFNGAAMFGGGVRRFSSQTTNGYMECVNARDFGLNDSGGDMTAAIQAAINSAIANHVPRVYVPASGSAAYSVTSLFITNGAGIVFQGDASHNGTGGTILYNGGNSVILTIGNGGVAVDGIQFQGGGFNAGGIGVATTSDQNANATAFRISNCYFRNLTRGLYINYAWTCTLFNNYFAGTYYGIVGTNYANDVHLYGGHFACIVGIDIRGDGIHSNDRWFIDSSFEVCSNAIRLQGANWREFDVSSYFEGSTNAIIAGAGKELNVMGSSFFTTAGSSATSTNIFLLGSLGASIEDSYFFDAWCNVYSTVAFTSFGNLLEAGGYFTVLSGPTPTAITFPATTVNWTNPTPNPIVLYVNNAGVPMTSFKVCGTQVFTTGATNCTVMLRPGDYFSQTYASGSPTASYLPFP